MAYNLSMIVEGDNRTMDRKHVWVMERQEVSPNASASIPISVMCDNPMGQEVRAKKRHHN
jgi:hypothetical protein